MFQNTEGVLVVKDCWPVPPNHPHHPKWPPLAGERWLQVLWFLNPLACDWLLWSGVAVPHGPHLKDERPRLSQPLGAPSLCVWNPATLLESSHKEALRTQRLSGPGESSLPIISSRNQVWERSHPGPSAQPSHRCVSQRNPSLHYVEQSCLAKVFPHSWPTKPEIQENGCCFKLPK